MSKNDLSLETLLEQFHSKDPKQRRQAAFALGAMQNPLIVPELLQAADDPDQSVRSFVASALARLGTAALEPLRIAVRTHNAQVRQVIALALHHMNDPQVVDDLIALLEDDDNTVRSAASEALRYYNTPNAQHALQKLEQTKPE